VNTVALSKRKLNTLTRFLSGISVLFVVGSQILFLLNRSTSIPPSWGHTGGARETVLSWLGFSSLSLILPAAAGLIGILVIAQHPHHPIGWLLALLGAASALSTFIQEWAIYGYYTAPGSLPASRWAAWITNWGWMILMSLLMWMIALFPDGRLKAGFWGASFAVLFCAFFLPTFIASNIEATFSSAYQIPSPFIGQTPEILDNPLFAINVPAMALAALVLVATIWARWRSSTPVMRQQIKWLIVGVGFMAGMITIGLALSLGAGMTIGEQLVNNAALAPLLAIGIAISRYRLYDVDLIIRRTLVYSLLTVMLAAVYFTGVTVFQGLVNSLTGQQSTLTIVLSTLIIAALFNPLRSRIQIVIDRRFYRQRYDADQALAGFASAARSEVEIDSLASELLSIVTATVQPVNASLWLKPGADHSSSRSSLRNLQTGD
jgi:hypothetical protein